MFTTDQLTAFQNSGIECLILSLNKPALSACFNKLSPEKQAKLIKDVSDFVESELTDNCGKKKVKIEELTDTNSI